MSARDEIEVMYGFHDGEFLVEDFHDPDDTAADPLWFPVLVAIGLGTWAITIAAIVYVVAWHPW